MASRRQSKAIGMALALGILGAISYVPAILAEEPADGKDTVKIPGLVDKDALDHFQFQPINVPVIRDGKVARILTVTVTMETKGGENKNKVMAQRYQLYDAFLRDIHGVASFDRADGRSIDPQVLKARLRAISDRILGEGTVENVLVLSIFDRKFS